MNNLPIDLLMDYESRGLLRSQTHPELPLIIWNYTEKVQYECLWDDLTLMCRGLVTDLDGVIISKGFDKFFNLEECRHQPTDSFTVNEKLDGQYIGAFFYNGQLVVNSRGSFTTEYAKVARQLLETKYFKCLRPMENAAKLSNSAHCFCFELIGHERIVVSYSEVDLVLTGVFVNNSEINPHEWVKIWNEKTPLQAPKQYDGLDYTQIKNLNWKNHEGFVVRFSNGSCCKVKFQEYVDLHRQVTNLSTTGIWEALMQKQRISRLLEAKNVPDEIYDDVSLFERKLWLEYEHYEVEHKAAFNVIVKYHLNNPEIIDRKDFAKFALKSKPHINPKILFYILDGKDYKKLIWQGIKPEHRRI